jgi:hypothetical protein
MIIQFEAIKVGQKVKGFIFKSKSGRLSSITTTEGDVGYGLNYHPNMDIYVGVEGEVVEVLEETFLVNFKNLRSDREECGINFDYEAGYDMWTYPIAEYLEINRNERLNELGI